MKKIISLMMVAALCLGISGCGNKKNESGNKGSDELVFWYMGDGVTQIKPLIDEFTEETGIKVNIQSIPWNSLSEKLMTTLSAKSGPDVMQMAVSRTAELVKADALVDLSDKIDEKEAFAKDNFYPVSYDSLEIDGKYYGVPWYSDVYPLFYRTDLFEEAGYQEFPDNWEDFYDACEKISKNTKKNSLFIPVDYNFLATPPFQAGSEIVTEDRKPVFNKKEFVESMDYLSSFYKKGLANRNQENNELTTLLANDDAAVVQGGAWLIPQLQENPELDGKWSIAHWPKGPANDESVYAGSNLGITTWSKKQDESLKLIEFLTKTENQVKYYETASQLPTSKAAWEEVLANDTVDMTVFRDTIATGKAFPKIPEIEEIMIEYTNYYERISVNDEKPQKVMDELQQKAEEILSR